MTATEDEKKKAAFDALKQIRDFAATMQHIRNYGGQILPLCDTIEIALTPAKVDGDEVGEAVAYFTEAKISGLLREGSTNAICSTFTRKYLTVLLQAATSQQGRECKCNIRTRLVGDGCDICNPDYTRANPPAADKLVRALRKVESSLFRLHENYGQDETRQLGHRIREALAEFEGGGA